MSDYIHHFSHEHPLKVVRVLRAGVSCMICNCLIPEDDKAYGCPKERCYYIIHIKCATFPEHISYSLHTLHLLTLAKRSFHDDKSKNNASSYCYYCDKLFTAGAYTYACDQCSNFHMHMACATIPLPAMTSDVNGGGEDHAEVVRYACHQHPMTLVDDDLGPDDCKGRAKCFACQSPWSGPAYSCSSAACENFFHKSCGELPRNIRHPFHSRHPLMLQVSGPRPCTSCCKNDCRLIYSCHEGGCNFILGTECASYNINVNSRSHDHLLSLVEKAYCDIQCDACQKSYKKLGSNLVSDEVNHTQSLQFRCMECSFNFHFLCGPLPSHIKYEYHIHPLTLVDHSTIEDLDSDEYYCDACENKTDLQFRMYYCADCKYAAHIHCVLLEIMKVLKGDTKDVELKALGENRWELCLEPPVLDDHDNTKENEVEQAARRKEMTMRDIVSKLTQLEKNMLADPADFDRPIIRTRRRNTYHFYKQRADSNFDCEKSIENIDRARQLFHFGSDDFFKLIYDELRSFIPEEGLRLDEKYLRQKVEDVEGYMVPKTLAPVLKTLLRKHGDLGGNSSLTPEMKSVASTFVCIAIDRMCRTKLEDVTRDDLRHLFFHIMGIAVVIGFDILRYFEGRDNIVWRAFVGFEAMRYEKDICEKLDLKIEMLEAELKRCKENRKKLETYASEKSDFLKQCYSVASEWKGKYWGDTWF